IIITSPEKELLRKYFLGYEVDISNYKNIEYNNIFFTTENYLDDAYELIEQGILRNSESVIGTIYSRTTLNNDVDHKYKKYIKDLESKYSQLLYFKISNNNEAESTLSAISELYDDLENYHYCAVEFNEACSWEYIYKIGIFAENFRSEKNLNAFKQKKQIDIMKSFINEDSTDSEQLADTINNFYSGVNYGFHFQDLIITKDGKRKLLVLQKVELNEDPFPCPSCFESIVRGNSYPKMLYKSFECNNPECPSRSKIGRGKRFDFYSVKRNNKLLLNSKENYIDDSLRTQFRKDIVDNNSDFMEFVVNFYTWSDSAITYISNTKLNEPYIFNRKTIEKSINDFHVDDNLFSTLPILSLLSEFNKFLEKKKENINSDSVQHVIDKATIINGNSTNLLNSSLYKDNFNLAVTSPP